MPSCYLTCPAYAVATAHQGRAALERAGSCCRELGWRLVPSPLLERCTGPGCWLDLDLRLADWTTACTHDAVWAFRGGYGALELALALNQRRPVARPPLLVGYSDITALHLVGGVGPGVYGPVAGQDLGERARDSLLGQLRGHGQTWTSDDLPAVRPLHPGHATGPLVATCLRVLASTAGTPVQPDLGGSILVIEDVDERPYAVDRDLCQLHAAGVLGGIVGLIGNSFPHRAPAAYAGPDHAGILAGWAARLGIPAIIGFPCGHDHDPISLAQGRASELRVDDAGWRLVQDARS